MERWGKQSYELRRERHASYTDRRYSHTSWCRGAGYIHTSTRPRKYVHPTQQGKKTFRSKRHTVRSTPRPPRGGMLHARLLYSKHAKPRFFLSIHTRNGTWLDLHTLPSYTVSTAMHVRRVYIHPWSVGRSKRPPVGTAPFVRLQRCKSTCGNASGCCCCQKAHLDLCATRPAASAAAILYDAARCVGCPRRGGAGKTGTNSRRKRRARWLAFHVCWCVG
jgi:hypothetical protein